jgi:hypothetical protein
MDSKREQLRLLGKAFYKNKEEAGAEEGGVGVEEKRNDCDEVAELRKRVEQLEELCLLMSEFLTIDKNDDDALVMGNRSLFSSSLSASKKDATSVEVSKPGNDSFISVEQIEHFVDNMLANQATNIGWIPDFIEKKLDRRILMLVFGTLANVFNTSYLELADNHKLTITMKPAPPSSAAQENQDEDEEKPDRPEKSLDTIVFKALQQFLATVKLHGGGHDFFINLE